MTRETELLWGPLTAARKFFSFLFYEGFWETGCSKTEKEFILVFVVYYCSH